MKVTYDARADALYIRFGEAEVSTVHVGDDIALDYDADGRLAGIEILDASAVVADAAKLADVVFENL